MLMWLTASLAIAGIGADAKAIGLGDDEHRQRGADGRGVAVRVRAVVQLDLEIVEIAGEQQPRAVVDIPARRARRRISSGSSWPKARARPSPYPW